MNKKNITVLVSGGGTNLQSLIDAALTGQISAEIKLVISDTKGAFALERAKSAGIDTVLVDKRDKERFPDKSDFDKALLAEIDKSKPDIIVLAGYLSILSKELISAYKNKIINIHPSLIPQFAGRGFYGHKVHEAVIAAGESKSGATVHFVDEGVDTGQIIIQELVELDLDETADTLAAKVLKVEHRILVEAVQLLCKA